MSYTIKFADGTSEQKTFSDSDAFKWYLGITHLNGIKIIGYIKNHKNNKQNWYIVLTMPIINWIIGMIKAIYSLKYNKNGWALL